MVPAQQTPHSHPEQSSLLEVEVGDVDVTAETEITVLEVDDWYGNREALDHGIEKQTISQANAR